MADDKQADIETVKDTQDEPMPSSDQKTPVIDASEPVREGEGTEAGLPEDAKERTRNEFEKLRGQLREERARREYFEQMTNRLQPKTKETEPQPVYDPATGYINEQALVDTQRRAREAESKAAKLEGDFKSYLQTQEERETFTVHPELDPKGKSFDRELHKATRRILLDASLNPEDYGGKQLSFKEAADLAKGVTSQVLEKARKEGAQDAVEQLSPKEQAALEAVGSPGRRTQVTDNLEELRQRTRRGDKSATMERLRAITS